VPTVLTELEELRQELNRLLDRVEGLSDPELLRLAQQLDRLIVREMKKALPSEGAGGEG
jgi:hypothetical protein